jgi:hypothetical protein
MNLESIGGIDFAALRTGCFHPSPAAWEDQVLYFLMLDRFSDDQENGYKGNDGTLVSTGSTPLFTPADAGNAVPPRPLPRAGAMPADASAAGRCVA